MLGVLKQQSRGLCGWRDGTRGGVEGGEGRVVTGRTESHGQGEDFGFYSSEVGAMKSSEQVRAGT